MRDTYAAARELPLALLKTKDVVYRENEVERGDKINPKYIRSLLLILANLTDNRASHIKEVPYAHSQSESGWPQIDI